MVEAFDKALELKESGKHEAALSALRKLASGSTVLQVQIQFFYILWFSSARMSACMCMLLLVPHVLWNDLMRNVSIRAVSALNLLSKLV